MSQEKVDAYKEKKANRKQEVEKTRKARVRNKVIIRVVEIVAGAALLTALVITGINMVKAYKAKQPVYDPEEYVLADYVGVTDEASEDVIIEDAEEEAEAAEGGAVVEAATEETTAAEAETTAAN